MRILLTGAFGNVGESTLFSLFEKDHDILCFDIETSQNKTRQRELTKLGTFKTVWGDITNPEIVEQAVQDIHCIIHLAAVIPPASDTNPDLARKVNVGGTLNLLNAAKKLTSDVPCL